MHCVTSAQANVRCNGHCAASFLPQMGLRQGDSMSPYLFVMCMNKLTHNPGKCECKAPNSIGKHCLKNSR